ncbi:class I SAM-dependent methyltransferase [Photobacterium makurazakiensis]|uniref:class I SAM-dependent methyltransferase n=1 Tax=Photobacterium makurazakiensis TaxID=2910234 RepID=UPI003D13901D
MTIEFYQNNADTFFDGTVNVDMTHIYQKFIESLPAGATILDAGCGSGRDTKAFLDMGFKVDAIDASSEMVERATAHTGIDVQRARFDEVEVVEKYDGIWTCASLLHVPEVELFDTLNVLGKSLKSGGVWYLSLKYGDYQREKDGRLFTDLNEELYENLLRHLSQFKCKQLWFTEGCRPGRSERWLNDIWKKK